MLELNRLEARLVLFNITIHAWYESKHSNNNAGHYKSHVGEDLRYTGRHSALVPPVGQISYGLGRKRIDSALRFRTTTSDWI